MGRARAPFSRNPEAEYVAVRRIKRGGGKYLEPGDDIPKNLFKRHMLKNFYLRRRIGFKGSDWAESMIKASGDAHARPEVTGVTKPTPLPTPPIVKSESPKKTEKKQHVLPDGVTIERKAAGWITILLEGEEIDQVRGDAALENWISKNG